MISLFRKIRQKLLEENKIGNYLKYAIGEILLVVIGIFIAIQANNWNMDRIEQKELKFELKKLTANLQQDVVSLNFQLESNQFIISNLDSSLFILKNTNRYSKADFMKTFFPINRTVGFNSNKVSFNYLTSSDKLQAIKSEALIDSLFAYYNSEQFKSIEDAMINHTRDVIRPYLMGFDFLSIGQESVLNHDDETEFSVKQKTLEDYAGDARIINGMRFKIFLHTRLKGAYENKIKEAESLINQIKEEIK